MKRTRRVRDVLFPCTPLLVVALIAACDAPPPDLSARMGAIIEAGGPVAPFADSHTTAAHAGFSESAHGEVFWCSRTTHDVVAGFGAFPVFDPHSEIAFPGNLLQGATLDWPTPLPIGVARTGGTISLMLSGETSAITRTLPRISSDWVAQTARDIVGKAGAALAARTTWSTSRVAAREQLGLGLHTPIDHLAPEVRAAFLYKSDVAYRRVLVALTQAYYTVDFALPADAAELFDPEITPEELARHIRPDNPATFVSSVTYGRVLYLLVQSTSSYEDMEAAIDATLRAAVSGEALAEEAVQISELEGLRVGGYALGGDGAKACQAVASGVDDLARIIAEGARVSTGTPVSYVVRNLARPDEVVRAKVAATFDVVECEPE